METIEDFMLRGLPLHTVEDLITQGLPFACRDEVYYPTAKSTCTVESLTTGQLWENFYFPPAICNRPLTELKNMDWFEEIPKPINIQQACSCDFHTQLLPYGCNCGGK
jgi:hypothetical protein